MTMGMTTLTRMSTATIIPMTTRMARVTTMPILAISIPMRMARTTASALRKSRR